MSKIFPMSKDKTSAMEKRAKKNVKEMCKQNL